MNRSGFVEKTQDFLSRRRKELIGVLAGELSRLGTDEDDESLDDEAYVELAERERHELELVEDTLERIRNGSYGECAACGHRISLARLQALPYATYCVKCQRAMEAHGSHNWLQLV